MISKESILNIIALLGSLSGIATAVIPAIEKTQYANILFNYAIGGSIFITVAFLVLFTLVQQIQIDHLKRTVDTENMEGEGIFVKHLSLIRLGLFISFSFTLILYLLLPSDPTINVISPERHFTYNPDVIPYKITISDHKPSMKLYVEYRNPGSSDRNKRLLDFDTITGKAEGEIHDERYFALNEKIELSFILEKENERIAKTEPILLRKNR